MTDGVMASSSCFLKCNQCNIVISEVLAFVQNKIEVMDNVSLIQICTSAFSEQDIDLAKKLLFQSLPSSRPLISRRGKGKETRDMEDIIQLFKEIDPELIPTFVARDLHKLPPVSFDHVDVTRLLKDILVLQSELEFVKETYITKQDVGNLINDVNKDIFELKNRPRMKATQDTYNSSECNINHRRGAYLSQVDSYFLESGPIGLTHLSGSECDLDNDSQLSISSNTAVNEPCTTHSQNQSSCYVPRTRNNSVNNADSISSEDNIRHGGGSAQATSSMRVEARTAVSTGNQVSSAVPPPQSDEARKYNSIIKNTLPRNQKVNTELAQGGAPLLANIVSNEINENGWTTVQYKKNKNSRFVAKKGKADTGQGNSFKAADPMISFYIYNVDKGASAEVIADYVLNKTSIIIKPHKINMIQKKDYEAYKFFVPKSKLSTFMDENLWPEGVLFRRFVHFKGPGKENNQSQRQSQDQLKTING